jgi:ankyrin repeat protein
MLAAQNGEISTVQVLLDNGVQTNALDPKGWSALTYAKSKQHVDVAAILASKGAL